MSSKRTKNTRNKQVKNRKRFMRHMKSKLIIIFAIIAVCLLALIGRLMYIEYTNGEAYKKQVLSHQDYDSKTLPYQRGDILDANGTVLATSVAVYNVILDCKVMTDKEDYIEPTIQALLKCFPDLEESKLREYVRERSNSAYIVLAKKLPYEDIQEFVEMQEAVDEKGKKVNPNIKGVWFETEYERQYPYGSLAYRALGQLKNDGSKVVGIEASCDSLLRGTDGKQSIRKTEHNRWIKDENGINVDPIDGLDVRTTIDIDIQEIAEKAMRHQLSKSNDIKYGTVIVMETATGRIRAMVNLNKGNDGKYYENYNYAIAGTGEPGSVFKLATLTLLLDEGKTTLNHVLSPAPKKIKCGKAAPMEDHYLDKYTSISVLRGFEISSNNVFRKLAWDYYHDKPTEFVDKLNEKIRISYNFDFDIEGLGHAHIKHPSERNDKGQRTWADSDLPQIAMGYTSRLAPLHTVNFYNAIANGGMMVRPRLIESLEKDGVVVKKFDVEEIGRVCSPKTAKELHRAMRSVVLEGTGETVFKGCKVEIAGKTGTARIDYGKNKGKQQKQHQATFAGFFPYENPKYTVIAVLYSNPSDKNYYGATWGGPVVREIAEELYATNPEWGEHIAKSGKMPENDNNASLRKALTTYEKEGYQIVTIGHGKLAAQEIDTLKERVTLIMQ